MTVATDNATPLARAAHGESPARRQCHSLADLMGLDSATRTELMRLGRAGMSTPEIRRRLSEDHGVTISPDAPLLEFYTQEAKTDWQDRYERASADADAIKKTARDSRYEFTDAILTAIGQETFRLITRDNIAADKLHQFASLILRAEEQDITRKAMELRQRRQEKLDRDKFKLMAAGKLDASIEALEKELNHNETALRHFEAMRAALEKED